jgi:Co/Zn/Cd efflux system component
MSAEMTTTYLRRAVLVVAVLNVLYGIVEFGVALVIGSVSLFADTVDFFEDASLKMWRLSQRGR